MSELNLNSIKAAARASGELDGGGTIGYLIEQLEVANLMISLMSVKLASGSVTASAVRHVYRMEARRSLGVRNKVRELVDWKPEIGERVKYVGHTPSLKGARGTVMKFTRKSESRYKHILVKWDNLSLPASVFNWESKYLGRYVAPQGRVDE